VSVLTPRHNSSTDDAAVEKAITPAGCYETVGSLPILRPPRAPILFWCQSQVGNLVVWRIMVTLITTQAARHVRRGTTATSRPQIPIILI